MELTLKEKAIDFLKRAARGEAKDAFGLYAAKNFIHHNAYFPGDAESLALAMEEAAQLNPGKIFEIQRVLHDGDLVAVHSRVKQSPTDPDIAVIHIFRFEGDKIAELWDFGQEAPDDMPNENGMF
jgi:predicted SnoaL-like aldol condensation-catalyzing enzyme